MPSHPDLDLRSLTRATQMQRARVLAVISGRRGDVILPEAEGQP